MSSCEKGTSVVREGDGERLGSISPCPEDTDPGGSSGSGGPNWSDEFKKRRHAFENAVENEDGGVFEYAEQAARSRKFREMMSQNPALLEPGLDYSRRRSDSSSSRDSSVGPLKSPSSVRPPPSWSSMPHPHGSVPQEPVANSRMSIDGQRFIDEDDDGLGPLGIIPIRHSSSNQQRVLAIGEETGQKERMVPYSSCSEPPTASSPLLQSDDNEREDTGLSQQIEFLTVKNQQLQKQLEERELERDRLREQLDTQRADKGHRAIYSPPGLPSRVLDGRKVLRDSVPLVTSPGCSTSSPIPPCSPLLHSPHRVASPLQRPRLPGQTKDYESSPVSKRGSSNPTEFIMPVKLDASTAEQYSKQVDALKRSNFELEKRLHELSEEKRKLEAELSSQTENFRTMQVREQDLLKDIETLRDENSHHTGAIKRLKGEREVLKGDNESLHDQLSTINDKLNKTEKYYKEVEHENLSLEADIKELMSEKRQLSEEKQKLQLTVENALKTKENYRSTIKQLREQNQSLESSMQPGAAAKAAKPGKKKVIIPTTKEQKTLGEVMDLREEKLQLEDRLKVAQQEIYSLEAHLKVQDPVDVAAGGEGEEEGGLVAHLSQFRSQVEAVRADLDTVQSAVSFFSSQQQHLVHDSFKMLAAKCRERIMAADKDGSRVLETLRVTEHSLQKMEKDFEIVKSENSKLQSHKGRMTGEISTLKSEIAKLQDQKRMQAVQISQSEALARDKDAKISKVEREQRELQGRFSTSEKNWKREYKKLELEWEGKVAEAIQSCELLTEEKEQLMAEKSRLEAQLADVVQDSKNLAVAKDEVESLSKQLEEKMVDGLLKADEHERTICKAQEDVARLLVQKAFLTAELQLDQEKYDAKVVSLREDRNEAVTGLNAENRKLQLSLASLEQEREDLAERLEEISSKERHIGKLESKISVLTRSQSELQTEMDALTKKHAKVIQDFRMLEDAEHSRRLDNEKVKMTLTTEIKLLKSKLSSVERERGKLEQKLSETASEAAAPSSAFHAVPPSTKQVDQLKKQVAILQSESKQQRKINMEAAGTRSSQLTKFQNRVTMLEAENLHLKDSALKTASSTHSSLDEEAVSTLRKKVNEMTRKTFFLESDKKNLNDKVKSLTTSLKSAREARDHVTNEHAQKLQDENKLLRERVHKLEGDLTKKLMAADAKIIDTVKENDKLRQVLLSVQSTLTADQSQSSGLDSFLSLLKGESEVLQDLKDSLAASSSELEKLELGHQRIEGLQQEIQLTLVSETEEPAEIAAPSGGRSLPAVFKSLPAGYISNLQGHKETLKPGSRSMSVSTVSNAELQKKMSEMNSVTSTFGQDFQRHRNSLKSKDQEVESVQERLASMEVAFRTEAERNRSIKSLLGGIQGMELKGEQLQSVMQRQIEQLQDQVIDRDSALSDIETQMKADFEMHHKKFALMKSQVIDLREELSACNDLLRSKDQYIQKTEERCLDLEGELFKMQKEMERRVEEQKELMRQGIPEGVRIQGVASVADVIRLQGEEMNQLKKLLHDFTRELSQVQSQLDSVQREKSVLQSKAIEMERMHIQMKEHMGSDINYLRQLNLQLVEQQMKTEKATEILKEVKAAQSAFKKQRDMIRMESELDASKSKIHEQHHKITELEYQLAAQALSLKLLHAEKDHSVVLTHHTPELTNKIPGIHMRPRSAESARKPNYKFKSRIGTSGLNMNNSEFSIVLPSQNSTHGSSGMDILNLEEKPEVEASQRTLSLGPMVVTDDEYSVHHQEVGKASTSKHQRCQRLRRGHRRTASTGSNIIPFTKEKEIVTPKSSNPIPLHSSGTSTKQKSAPKNPKRPGSAGSSRQDVHIRQESRVQPTEQITKAAHAISEYVNNLIDDHSQDDPTKLTKLSMKKAKDKLERLGGKDTRGGGAQGGGGALSGAKPTVGKFEVPRNKLANKSTDSNETTSSDGNGFSSKGSSQSDSSGPRQDSKRAVDFVLSSAGVSLSSFPNPHKVDTDLSRTESMSSTCSTLSIYGNTLPSRNHSFTYDGGESSAYESLEIGDSVENLQALGKLGYSPYITPIMPSEYTTSSSDDENYRKNRRKKSSTTGDNTPRHKDTVYHSNNSSCDSDSLQQDGYHSNSREPKKLGDIPAHVNESISISDMDRDTTDIEMDQKAADLQHCFGRVRYSSTGSVKICYSESSNTSMEDISKN